YITCGTPITSYAWSFTNGTPATSTLPQPGQVTFSGSGGFAYSITTTSACGPVMDGGVINILDSPPASTITPTDDPITVCQGQPLSLTAANDPGVTFVWTAPDGSQYTQANVNIAAATLAMAGTWSVVASQGPCPGPPATVDVIVTQAPNIAVVATPAEYCIGQGTTLSASNAGNYVWTVNGTPVGTGAVIAVDTNQTLTYTVTGDLGGCGASASVLVTVNPLPIVDAGPPLNLCDQPIGELLVPVTPGGVWSGPNLTLPNTYTPNGQTPLNDPDTLVYTYTDGNGCVASDAIAVAVGPAPAPVTATPDTLICLNSGGLQLTASTAGGQWSGTPWVDASGLFTPGALGTFVVNYALGAGSCLVEDDVEVEVVNGTAVDAGADFDVCANDPPVLLAPNPIGGVWSGTGLDINDAFDPALVIPDATYSLTYTFNDPNGCVIIDVITVHVDPLPVIDQTIDTTFCNQPFPQQIIASPLGGTWSGPNVDGTGLYTPNGITPPNVPDVLAYSYTDGNGCTNTGSTEVTVIDPPFVANAGNDTAVCVFDPPFALGGDPAGGDWSGPQVTPLDLFDPQSVGSFLITYAVGSASCATLDQREITVDPLPVVDIGTDTSVCVSDAPFVLWTSASGGSWQPEPYLQADGTFDPALSTIGVAANCCYTYTDPNTECSNTFCRAVTVNSLPIVQLTDTIGCENDPLPFANTNPPAAQWLWTFGDGSSPSTDQFPSHVYTAAGTYTVQLTATSGAGCVDSAQATVVIAAIPDAVVDWTPIDTCGDGNLQVLNTAEVPGSTHAWTVNGTIVSTDAQPGGFALIGPVLNDTLYTITYAQGNYCGSTSAPFVITLHPLPVASFGTDQLIYCLADTVFIGNDSYGLPDSTQWTLGDGTTTTNEAIIWYHLYTQDSASWTITQEVYNGCGADTATATVTVLPNEVTSFFNTDVVIGCAPLTPTFTNFSDGDTTSVWYFGDADNSTSVSTNTGFTYTEPGVYTVMLVSYGCGVDSAYQTINVLALPVVTTQNDTAICLGQPITFAATGAGLVGLEWDFGDGTGDSIPQPTHVYAQAGNYQVILTVVNGSTLCPSSDTINVTVIASPSAVITATDSVICAGGSIDFNSTGTIGNNLIYDWTVDATSFSFQSNPPPQTYTSAGSYAIGLLVEDQLTGCTDSAARTIVVNEMPESSFTLAPVDPCGDPAWILATSTSTPPNALLQWSIDGAYISSGPSFQQSWDTPGTHTLTLHTELPGCVDSSSAAFELYEIPIAAFEPGVACIGQPVPVVDGSSNVEDYWWYFNGTIVSTADNPVSLIPTDLGLDTIALAITSPEGCRDSTWIVVEVHPTPEASMDVVLEADCQTITMRGTPYPLGSYLWLVDGVPYSEELNTIYLYDQTVTASITITFVVTSIDSCVDPVSRTLDIPACVHVPNAFTADGDGNNESFLPVVFPAERFRAFRVFDRWGELIHESLGQLKGWDGTYQGSPCMQGVYVWQVDH
ncbi:MAG: PKD domain-containing protein, partial [Flavobacteriales bacterium]|nr:PKD domain-containing protein [Flavobacteriales bacterium]